MEAYRGNGGIGGPSEHARLDECLHVLQHMLEPSAQQLAMQAECMRLLGDLVRQLGPDWRLDSFGSAANGFLTRGADLDVTCYQTSGLVEDPKTVSRQIKRKLLPALSKLPHFSIKDKILKARVPIVKLKFRDYLDVDLSCHNQQALHNTYLLRAYANLNPIVRGLVLCVKHWSKQEGVVGAAMGNLSSYSLTLMALYFLQVDVTLAMPCIPTAYASMANMSWYCVMPLADVLRRFFVFYGVSGGAGFAWGFEVVSVRTGRRNLISDPIFSGLPGREAERLHLEDPFLSRNLNCVLTTPNEERLKLAFQEAAAAIDAFKVPRAFFPSEEASQLFAMHSQQAPRVIQPLPGKQMYMYESHTALADELEAQPLAREQLPWSSNQPPPPPPFPKNGWSNPTNFPRDSWSNLTNFEANFPGSNNFANPAHAQHCPGLHSAAPGPWPPQTPHLMGNAAGCLSTSSSPALNVGNPTACNSAPFLPPNQFQAHHPLGQSISHQGPEQAQQMLRPQQIQQMPCPCPDSAPLPSPGACYNEQAQQMPRPQQIQQMMPCPCPDSEPLPSPGAPRALSQTQNNLEAGNRSQLQRQTAVPAQTAAMPAPKTKKLGRNKITSDT